MNIFIYGVPGAGKTHYSKKLGKELGLKVVEADQLRKITRKNKSKRKFPFLYLATCLAYQFFGELTQENAIKGLLAVRHALVSTVEEEVQNIDSTIIEGAFLDPHVVGKLGKTILLITKDEQKHKKQFLHHREKLFDFKGNEFESARLVQEYLIAEAQKLGIEVIEN